jgi:peptidoglycan/LPS O-acetylase OafA/YrhL
MHYRRDIDGLRAIAVLAVVAFHAKLPFFAGGFVGVDVFFVISGFLITGQIADNVKAGHFSFAEFYHRRIRRIAPALMVVYVASAFAALALLLPREVTDFGKSLQYSAIFLSNFFFYSTTGYFDGPADLKPLLHTWSLSIEEQFYFFWPALLLLVIRHKPHSLIRPLALVGVTSLVAFVAMVFLQPEAAFFLTPLRIWELMLGAFLAVNRHRPPPALLRSKAASLAGLVLILTAVVLVDGKNHLSLLATVPACTGAALIILNGPNSIANRLLSTRPLVGIGLISYSLYLWHWPLLAFARYHVDRSLATLEVVLLIAAAFAAATATYFLVERPARKISFARVRPVVVSTLAVFSMVTAIGYSMAHGRISGFNLDAGLRDLDAAVRSQNPFRRKCFGAANAFRNDDICTFGAPRKNGSFDMVILGDSHADHFVPTMALLAEKAGLSGRQITVGGCLALLGYHSIISPFADERRCRALREALPRFIESNPGLKLVVLAHRWSAYNGLPVSEGREQREPFYVTESPTDERSARRSLEVLRESLRRTVNLFEQRNIRVLLLGEVPPLGKDPTRCIANAIKKSIDPNTCGRSKHDVDQETEHTASMLLELSAGSKQTTFLSPIKLMCSAHWCGTVMDNVYLYRDSTHLNRVGAQKLADALILPIGKKAPASE